MQITIVDTPEGKIKTLLMGFLHKLLGTGEI